MVTENLAVFIERVRTWSRYHRCDEALETASSIVKTGDGTRSILKGLHSKQLVAQSHMVLEALNEAVENDVMMLRKVMEIGTSSEAWRELV